MQKATPSVTISNLLNEKKIPKIAPEMQPSTASLAKILQFASLYRAQQIDENQHIDFFLN